MTENGLSVIYAQLDTRDIRETLEEVRARAGAGVKEETA